MQKGLKLENDDFLFVTAFLKLEFSLVLNFVYLLQVPHVKLQNL